MKKNEKGAALVMTILVLAVLVIISTILLSLSLAETKLAAYQDKKKQAYYLARSGAEAVAVQLMKNSNDDTKLFGRTSNSNSQMANGSFSVRVESIPTGHSNIYNVKITGTGYVDGEQSTASVTLYRRTWNEISTNAIYSNGELKIDNMRVQGDIQAAGEITYSKNGSNKYDDTKYTATPNTPMYLTVSLPSTLPAAYVNQDVTVTNHAAPLTLSSSWSFNSITINNHGKLIIDATAGDIDIVLNTLTIDNILEIKSSGGHVVNIYVKNLMDIQTKGLINNTDPQNLNIVMLDGSTFNMQANMTLNGYVTGPGANIRIQSNDSTINGYVIGNTVTKNGSGGPNGAVNFILDQPPEEIPEWLKSYKIVDWDE